MSEAPPLATLIMRVNDEVDHFELQLSAANASAAARQEALRIFAALFLRLMFANLPEKLPVPPAIPDAPHLPIEVRAYVRPDGSAYWNSIYLTKSYPPGWAGLADRARVADRVEALAAGAVLRALAE